MSVEQHTNKYTVVGEGVHRFRTKLNLKITTIS